MAELLRPEDNLDGSDTDDTVLGCMGQWRYCPSFVAGGPTGGNPCRSNLDNPGMYKGKDEPLFSQNENYCYNSRAGAWSLSP